LKNSKRISQNIIKALNLMIPPTELEFAIEKLEKNLTEKRAERDKKIKNLKSKSKKKKKAPKILNAKLNVNLFKERALLFSEEVKILFLETMDSLKQIHETSES
jgi:hypothetical protein